MLVRLMWGFTGMEAHAQRHYVMHHVVRKFLFVRGNRVPNPLLISNMASTIQ